MKIKYLVYGLVCPIEKIIRYVGKSEDGLSRPKDHFNDAWRMKDGIYIYERHTHTWIRELGGLKPIIVILAILETNEDLYHIEHCWIMFFKSQGYELTNKVDYGPGVSGMKHTDETKALLSELTKKQMATPELKAKVHAAQMEYWSNPDNLKIHGEKQKKRFENYDERVKASLGQGKGQFQDQFGNIYTFQKEAMEATGVGKNGISAILNGKLEHCKGYVFRYLVDGVEPPKIPIWLSQQKEKAPNIIKRIKKPICKPFMDNFGNKFNYVKEAALKLNLNSLYINRVLRGERKHTKGYKFHYIEELKNDV